MYQGNTLTVYHLVAMENGGTQGGDSGGPWFRAGTAAGIHLGVASVDGQTRSIFSKFDELGNAFGLNYICHC